MSDFFGFIHSDAGFLARYEGRKRRRIYIGIHDIEPQSKKMPGAEQDKFQNAVATKLASLKRSTFHGHVALKINLATTSRNAPQAHTIAKNLLDLLGTTRTNVKWPKRHLLYKDDSQIQALSISCRHGEADPYIGIEVRPFSAMLDDLELAAKATYELDMSSRASMYDDREDEWIDTLRELLDDEKSSRITLGDDGYVTYVHFVRWRAQRAILARSGVNIPMLCYMYGLPKGLPTGLTGGVWSQYVSASKLRLQVGQLPTDTGGSTKFKERIAAEIATFKKRWNWIIDPLLIAVALEVVVRPDPDTPAGILHDLDNIVRDYLLPQIVPSFDTVTDHRWKIDFEELRRRNPELADSWGTSPTPPVGTRSGVTRYEVWRLPALEGEPGFVSVALVADTDGKGDLIGQMDEKIGKWKDEKVGDRHSRYWR